MAPTDGGLPPAGAACPRPGCGLPPDGIAPCWWRHPCESGCLWPRCATRWRWRVVLLAGRPHLVAESRHGWVGLPHASRPDPRLALVARIRARIAAAVGMPAR